MGSEVTFYYSFEHAENCQECPVVSIVESDEVQDKVNDTASLSKLQKECPEFSGIYKYLETNALPEEAKERDKIVSESKSYSLTDGVLYHWFQRHCRGVDAEFHRIKQIALPKCLRHEALISYHDSLAAGGHFGIEKVNNPWFRNTGGKECTKMSQIMSDLVTDVKKQKQTVTQTNPLLQKCPK